MDISGYLFTVNKSRSCKLDLDELKDVQQETEITLSQKSYNDQMVRYTILSAYREAVRRKIRREQLAAEQAYIISQNSESDNSDFEIEKNRTDKLKKLDLTPIQKKIVLLLIQGADYKEIQKKLKLTSPAIRNHVKRIKKNNSVGITKY